MYIYDKDSNRLLNYQSHDNFNLESVKMLFNQNPNMNIEKYENDIYEKLDRERILMKDLSQDFVKD